MADSVDKSQEMRAERIKKLREEFGFSKADMARMCGITQTAYTNIENAETRSITIETGKKIANSLKISFFDLFDIDGDSRKIDSLKNEIEALKKRIIELERFIELQNTENKSIKQDVSLFLYNYLKNELSPIGFQIRKESNSKERRKLFLKWNEINHKFHDSILSPFLKSGIISKEDFEQMYSFEDPLFDFFGESDQVSEN